MFAWCINHSIRQLHQHNAASFYCYNVIVSKARFPLPELTGDRFSLHVNTGRVDGRPVSTSRVDGLGAVNSGPVVEAETQYWTQCH